MMQCGTGMTAILLISLAAVGQGLPGAVVPVAEKQDGPEAGKEPIVCTVCMDITQKMTSHFVGSILQKDVEDFLKALCPSLPLRQEQEGKVCKILVQVFKPLVTEVINLLLSPRIMCEAAGVCPITEQLPSEQPADSTVQNSTTALPTLRLPLIPSLANIPLKQDNSNCDRCISFVNVVLHFFSSNTTKEIVGEAVEELCRLVASGLRDQCRSFMHEYAPMVVAMTAEHYIHPRQTCEVFGLCHAGKPSDHADQDNQHIDTLRLFPAQSTNTTA
ncbi:prosaposin-like isoform X1 [Babylonia areolata]|uniref:prosaposin-like isoform X1 n=1 Tax=Babylonia areolata TaxID=304850 RepID=UPI003FD2B38E